MSLEMNQDIEFLRKRAEKEDEAYAKKLRGPINPMSNSFVERKQDEYVRAHQIGYWNRLAGMTLYQIVFRMLRKT